MKRLKTSTRFSMASLILCTALAAGLLIFSQIVIAASLPIPGIVVTIKKNAKPVSNARTNQEGRFTVGNLEPGELLGNMKHAEEYPFSGKFKTVVITIEGVKGGKVEKRFPIGELRRGVTFDIEIVERSAGTIVGTCVAISEESVR